MKNPFLLSYTGIIWLYSMAGDVDQQNDWTGTDSTGNHESAVEDGNLRIRNDISVPLLSGSHRFPWIDAITSSLPTPYLISVIGLGIVVAILIAWTIFIALETTVLAVLSAVLAGIVVFLGTLFSAYAGWRFGFEPRGQ